MNLTDSEFIDDSEDHRLTEAMMSGYLRVEQAAMEMLLRGDDPALQQLRVQWARGKVTRREFTHEFCTTFDIPSDIRLPSQAKQIFTLRDVEADISGVPVMFVLSVADGVISSLAAYTKTGQPWPESPIVRHLRYSHAVRQGRNARRIRKVMYDFPARHPFVFGLTLTAITVAFADAAIEQIGKSVVRATENASFAVVGAFALVLFIIGMRNRRTAG